MGAVRGRLANEMTAALDSSHHGEGEGVTSLDKIRMNRTTGFSGQRQTSIHY